MRRTLFVLDSCLAKVTLLFGLMLIQATELLTIITVSECG